MLQACKHPPECSRWVLEYSHCFHRGNLIKRDKQEVNILNGPSLNKERINRLVRWHFYHCVSTSTIYLQQTDVHLKYNESTVLTYADMCFNICLTYLYKVLQSSCIIKLYVQILFNAQNAKKIRSDQVHMATPAYYHTQSIKKYPTIKNIYCIYFLAITQFYWKFPESYTDQQEI